MPISINAYWAAAAVVHCVWHIDHAIVAAVIVDIIKILQLKALHVAVLSPPRGPFSVERCAVTGDGEHLLGGPSPVLGRGDSGGCGPNPGAFAVREEELPLTIG